MDPNQNDIKQQIVDRLKEARNILVTVSADPSVDQLASAIGLTLLLTKLGKHGTAVFSGKPPSTLEFLQPEQTLEKTTDSLRDFIISLDKSKADKLRYKVEEKVVKIFITPYRTSLSKKDLDFSQGDFNVEVVIALGVQVQEELDQAVLSQARILHDATVISINNKTSGSLGSINWLDEQASSLSEMAVYLGEALKDDFLDPQMATAFLTGIVAETDRFSNDKTNPRTMVIAGKLMTAGANQHLIASQLEEPEAPPESEQVSDDSEDGSEGGDEQAADSGEESDENTEDDGSLQIMHDDRQLLSESSDNTDEAEQEDEESTEQIHTTDEGEVIQAEDQPELPPSEDPTARILTKPPTMGGTLTANTEPEDPEDSSDALSLPEVESEDAPLLSRHGPPAAPPEPAYIKPPEADEPEQPSELPTVSEIEERIHEEEEDTEKAEATEAEELPDPNAARYAIEEARAASPDTERLEPLQALNAQPVDLDLGHEEVPEPQPTDEAAAPMSLEAQPTQADNPQAFELPQMSPFDPAASGMPADDEIATVAPEPVEPTALTLPPPPLDFSSMPTNLVTPDAVAQLENPPDAPQSPMAPPPVPPPFGTIPSASDILPSSNDSFQLPPAQ